MLSQQSGHITVIGHSFTARSQKNFPADTCWSDFLKTAFLSLLKVRCHSVLGELSGVSANLELLYAQTLCLRLPTTPPPSTAR